MKKKVGIISLIVVSAAVGGMFLLWALCLAFMVFDEMQFRRDMAEDHHRLQRELKLVAS